jgi:hypothetical protein
VCVHLFSRAYLQCLCVQHAACAYAADRVGGKIALHIMDHETRKLTADSYPVRAVGLGLGLGGGGSLDGT